MRMSLLCGARDASRNIWESMVRASGLPWYSTATAKSGIQRGGNRGCDRRARPVADPNQYFAVSTAIDRGVPVMQQGNTELPGPSPDWLNFLRKMIWKRNVIDCRYLRQFRKHGQPTGIRADGVSTGQS